MNNTDIKNPLPAWNKYLLRDYQRGDDDDFRYGSSVLMGHYLIVIVTRDLLFNRWTSLFAIDLRDNSVQESGTNERLIYNENDALIKCNENQILFFGGNETNHKYEILRIQSFQPFQWVSKEVTTKEPRPILQRYTAQISRELLYVYGQSANSPYLSELWSLNLNSLTWELHNTVGEDPGLRDWPSSCIIEENLYIFGGSMVKNDDDHQKDDDSQSDDASQNHVDGQNDIFELDLSSMTWTRLEQERDYFSQRERTNMNCGVYKSHLIVLDDVSSEKDQACCWDAYNDSWSTFNIKRSLDDLWTTNPVVYKNLLLRVEKAKDGIYMVTLNLQNFGLSIPETPEAQFVRSLFMNEEEADIIFKIGDQTIPAHKTILTQKSRYFANLFNSGMSESRQQIIEIDNCEYHLFKEFLRFLYFDEAQLNENLAIKLVTLADKHLQDDLIERCQDFLIGNLNSDNVYTLLDYAQNEEIENLEGWCLKFLKSNINVKNISELITYLNKQPQKNVELRDHALNFIVRNHAEIYESERNNFEFYEDFLIKTIGVDTILTMASLICSAPKEYMANLREGVFLFTHENFEQLREKKIAKEFSKDFLMDLVSYKIRTQNKSITQIENSEQTFEEISDPQSQKGKKRMEPVQKDDDSNGKPILKKTKKSPSPSNNEN